MEKLGKKSVLGISALLVHAANIDELYTEFEGKAVIGKVNVDEAASISSKYGIRNIPTLLFIKSGEVVDKHVGSASKEDLSQKLSNIL